MLKKIETVVIGMPLTQASDLAVRTGLKVARAANAKVVLVHAFSPQLVYAGAPFVPEVPQVVEAQKESLRLKMEEQAHWLGIRPEERSETFLEPGPAHQVLIETARKTNADLIVVGSTETPRLSKVFGSTADRVVRKATCPVLVIRRDLPIPPARVLLPVDLSFLSAEAVHEGLEILGLLWRGEQEIESLPEVEALYVITDVDRHLFPSELAPEEAQERAERYTLEELGRFLAQHAAGSALKVVPKTVSGEVEDEILARIREWEPSLVVIGTHGRSGFERFLLGSVAARTVQDGTANVLVVPPAAARKQAEAVREAIQREALVA